MQLDLTKRKAKYLELTLLDGTKLNVKKPSKDMILDLDDFNASKIRQKSSEDVFTMIENMTLKILNCNIDCKKFDEKYLDDNGIDYEVCTAIITAYEEFLREVMSNPN